MEGDLILSLVLFTIFFLVLFYIYYRAQQKIKLVEIIQNGFDYSSHNNQNNLNHGRQDNDVWNISGRMNGADNWPTHDHHVSIDSFAFPPEYQAKDPRNAPPPYTEVDLPTYEEAILACENQKNNPQVVVVPVHGGHRDSSN